MDQCSKMKINLKPKGSLEVTVSEESKKWIAEAMLHPEKRKFDKFYGLENYSDVDKLCWDLELNLLSMVKSSVDSCGIKSEVNMEVGLFSQKEMMTMAFYRTQDSSNQQGFFDLNLMEVLGAFYGDFDSPVSRIIYPVRNYVGMKKVIDHELRHHLDHQFLSTYRSLLAVDEEEIPLRDRNLLNKIILSRTEGYASFDRDNFNPRNFEKLLQDHTSSVITYFNLLQEVKDEKDYRMLMDLNNLNDNGLLRDSSERLPYWQHISPYNQGHFLMEVIACAKMGQVKNITKKDYQQTLNQVRKLNFRDFFQLYFKSIDALGLTNEQEIFSRAETNRVFDLYVKPNSSL